MNRSVIAALLSLALSGVARAQDSADEQRKEEARLHVSKAKVHYDLGEFKEAADEYIIVYRLRPIPALLFNIAQAYRQGGMYDKARQFYKSYLRESPDAKNKAMIEQSIREMNELLAKEKRTKEAAPTGVKDAPEASLPMTASKKPAETPVNPPDPAPKVAEVAPQPKPIETAKPPETRPIAVAPTPAPAAAKPPVTVAIATPPRPPAPVAVTSTAPVRQPAAEEGGSVLTKWWLWTAVGVVAVGAGVAAMSMGGNQPPPSHFPTTPVFP